MSGALTKSPIFRDAWPGWQADQQLSPLDAGAGRICLAAPATNDDLWAPAAGLGFSSLFDAGPLFRGKPQLQLEADAAQHVARAVADLDRVVRAIVEEPEGPFKRLVFSQEGFYPGQTFFAHLLGRTRQSIVIGDRIVIFSSNSD